MKSSVKGDKKEESTQINPETDLMQVVKDLQVKIANLEANKGSEVKTEGEGIIPLDDYLQSPVVFFAYSTSFVLAGDLRRGKRETAPNDEMVKFRRQYRYERRSAGKRGVEIVSTCSVRVQSKSLAEWLRGHTLFGTKFFENMKDAENVDVTFAEKMSQVQGLIGSMSDMQVIERAQGYEGINLNTPNVDNIRKQLVERIARDEMQNESSRAVKRYVNGYGKSNAKVDEEKLQKGNVQGDVY